MTYKNEYKKQRRVTKNKDEFEIVGFALLFDFKFSSLLCVCDALTFQILCCVAFVCVHFVSFNVSECEKRAIGTNSTIEGEDEETES
jgi:hypothetical protein